MLKQPPQSNHISSALTQEGKIDFYQSLSRLHQNEDFQIVVSVLEVALHECDVNNRHTTNPDIFRTNQGAAQLMGELLDSYRRAHSLAKTAKSSPQNRF